MPTNGKAPDVLVDTSVAVALSVTDHELHDLTIRALEGRRLGLAGHAAFETFSVLTLLPPPARRPPSVVVGVIRENFPASRFLSVGGAAAVEHASPLATVDRRALDTYRVLGVEVELLSTGGRSA